MPDRTATSTRGLTGSPRFKHEDKVLIRQLVYAAFFLEVGLLLVVLPWSSFWDHNYFGEAWPVLQPVLTNNFVRGAVTGLGLVNLVAGFADLALVFASRGRDVSVHDSGRP